MTMDEHRVARMKLTEDLVGNLGCPALHIFDFRRLEVIVDGQANLNRNRGMKRYLFRAVEHGFDPVRCEPLVIVCDFPATDPDTGDNHVDIFIGRAVGGHLTVVTCERAHAESTQGLSGAERRHLRRQAPVVA